MSSAMPHREATLIKAPRCGHQSVLASAAVGNVLQVPVSHDQAAQSLGLENGATTGPALPKSWSLGTPLKRRRPPKTSATTVASTTCTPSRQNTHTAHAGDSCSPTPPLPLAQRNLSSLNARPARASNDDIKGRVAEDDPDIAAAADAVDAAGSITAAPFAPHGGCCHEPSQQQWTHPHQQPRPPQKPDKGDTERQEREKGRAAIWAAELAQLRAETDRILTQQARRDMGRRQRLELQLSASRPLPPLPLPSSSPLPSPKTRSLVLEKISLLARGRRVRGTGLSPTSTSSLRSEASSSISPTSSVGASLDLGHSNKPVPMTTPMNFIEAGGRGQTDAPRGASNGGDRRATVRCRGAAMGLVVGVETTAVDILVASSDQAAQPINVKTSTLTELCAQFGLERRIRRYERIRDVLNSWDQDTQNTLIVSPDLPTSHSDLDLASVPYTDKPPSGFILPLYHSQKHGKWSKRYITLFEGGQLLLSKKLQPGPSDKDVLNLCHLSDYDIYIPTETQKRKQLKPPKKYCYAIKSQQKAAVFQSTDNYVHYFCTEDPDVGQEFHSGVHAWRSWYIVNRALELHAKKKKVAPEEEKPPQILPDKPSLLKKSVGHVKVNGHKVSVSVDESPYAIGAFEPLINLRRFDKPLEEFGNDWVPDPRQSIALPTSASPQNGEYKKDLLVNMPERGQGAFAEGGLLGAAYDKRKQAQQEGNGHAQMTEKVAPGPFIEGPSLLNSRKSSSGTASTTSNTRPSLSPGSIEKPANSKQSSDKAEASSWFPSAIEHSAKTRLVGTRPSVFSGSTSQYEREYYSRHQHHQQHLHSPRRAPQPLVDLTPTFVEPPQWSRHNTGRGYRAPEGKPLVDFATGPPISSSRMYEPPPQTLVRRGDAGSIHSSSSRQSRPPTSGDGRTSLGRRQTVRSDRPPVSGRPMGAYDQGQGQGQGQGYPLLSRDNRSRAYTPSSGPPLSMQSSPPVSLAASERGSRKDPRDPRAGRERSGTLV